MASVASYNPAPIGGVDNHSHAHSHMDYSVDGGTASPGASVASSSASPRDEDQHPSHRDEGSFTASIASSAPSRDEDGDAGAADDARGDEIDERMHEESDAFSFATANNEGSGAEFKTHDFAADEDDGEDGDAEDVVEAVAPEEDYDDDEDDDDEDDGDQSSSHIQTQETQQDDVSEMSSDDRHRQGESSTAVPNNMSSYASSLNSNSSANLFNQPCDNNNYVSSSHDNNIQESSNKSSSSSMIDQESFYSHISSPQARFEANKQAFESRFSSGNSVLSNYSTASKKSAKSVRRRDVITPLADFGDWNSGNNSKTASASPIADGATPAAPGDGAQAGAGEVFRPVPVAPSNPESAMVLHSNNNAANSHQWTLPEQPPPADSRALVVHSKHKSPSRPRGLEPDEAACRGRSGRDPPGESPNERPFIGAPRVNRSSDESVGSNTSRNSRKPQWNMRNVQWVDPKTVMNERDIDFGVLRHYERLANVDGNDDSGMDFPDPSNYNECRGMDADGDYQGMMTGGAHSDIAANPLHPCSELLTPKRIRIATISSGYKKANFFVREDLDQRIYFHDLEDAINYMAKRGYARMRKEDELEWMKLLGKAHGVVKVGPTKKKQRYRKGKLVLIMSKPITDDYPFRTPPSSSKNNKNITTLALVARKNTNSDESTAASSHTSIGRSIRGPYKSYSEKFLAEQEEEKRILLGEPPRLMMLTNGPVDPEPQQELLQLTNGSGDEDDVISEGDEESSSKMSASKKSSNASEARMVNYRGGVMYFTPHQYEESDDDDDDDDEETEEEEDNTYQEDDDDETEDMSSKYEEEEEATTNSEEESSCSGVESSHTDAESSTNSEMSSIARNSGVKIAPGGNGKSTLNAKRAPTPYDKDAMRKNRQSSPPDMEPISDDSEDSSLISGEA